MSTSEIKALLSKFTAGDTTEQEEKILKEFFLKREVPPELEGFRSLFMYYSEAGEVRLEDDGFEEMLLERIQDEKTQVVRLKPNHRNIFYVSATAASILFLLSMFFLFNGEKNADEKREISITSEQQILYNQAHDILALVSVNLNRGIEKAAYLGKFDVAMHKMEMLSKYYQYQSLIINPDHLEGSVKNK